VDVDSLPLESKERTSLVERLIGLVAPTIAARVRAQLAGELQNNTRLTAESLSGLDVEAHVQTRDSLLMSLLRQLVRPSEPQAAAQRRAAGLRVAVSAELLQQAIFPRWRSPLVCMIMLFMLSYTHSVALLWLVGTLLSGLSAATLLKHISTSKAPTAAEEAKFLRQYASFPLICLIDNAGRYRKKKTYASDTPKSIVQVYTARAVLVLKAFFSHFQHSPHLRPSLWPSIGSKLQPGGTFVSDDEACCFRKHQISELQYAVEVVLREQQLNAEAEDGELPLDPVGIALLQAVAGAFKCPECFEVFERPGNRKKCSRCNIALVTAAPPAAAASAPSAASACKSSRVITLTGSPEGVPVVSKRKLDDADRAQSVLLACAAYAGSTLPTFVDMVPLATLPENPGSLAVTRDWLVRLVQTIGVEDGTRQTVHVIADLGIGAHIRRCLSALPGDPLYHPLFGRIMFEHGTLHLEFCAIKVYREMLGFMFTGDFAPHIGRTTDWGILKMRRGETKYRDQWHTFLIEREGILLELFVAYLPRMRAAGTVSGAALLAAIEADAAAGDERSIYLLEGVIRLGGCLTLLRSGARTGCGLSVRAARAFLAPVLCMTSHSKYESELLQTILQRWRYPEAVLAYSDATAGLTDRDPQLKLGQGADALVEQHIRRLNIIGGHSGSYASYLWASLNLGLLYGIRQKLRSWMGSPAAENRPRVQVQVSQSLLAWRVTLRREGFLAPPVPGDATPRPLVSVGGVPLAVGAVRVFAAGAAAFRARLDATLMGSSDALPRAQRVYVDPELATSHASKRIAKAALAAAGVPVPAADTDSEADSESDGSDSDANIAWPDAL